MKILIFDNVSSPYREDFYNLLGLNNKLTVVFERKSSFVRDKSWLNHNFNNFNAIFLNGIAIGEDTAYSFGFKRFLKDKYDAICVMNSGSITGFRICLYLAKKGIPFFIETDGCFYIEPKTFKQKLKFKIKKKFYEKAVGCFASCYNSRKTFLSLGVKEDRIINYSFTSLFEKDLLSVPLSDKEKQEYKSGLGIKAKKVVLAVGQFIERKGFDVLIESAKYLGDGVKVCFVGGQPTQYYLDLIKKLGINNVDFIGFTLKEDLKLYYRAADVFVLPTREDIWGLVINEAMANALPIITTDMCVAGIELVKNDENGFILPVGDYCALAEKINEIVNDDEKRIAFSERSLEKIRAYTIENMVNEHLDAFKRLQSKGNN